MSNKQLRTSFKLSALSLLIATFLTCCELEGDDGCLAFIGLERMGGVMVYDVTNPYQSRFVDYFYNRGTVEGAEATGDLAPEGMVFVDA